MSCLMFSSIVAGFGTICEELFLNVMLNLARKTRREQRNSRLFWQEIFAFDCAARKKNTLSRPGTKFEYTIGKRLKF